MMLAMLVLISSITMAYDDLKPMEAQSLLEKAQAICQEIKQFSVTEKDERLAGAYTRHCVQAQKPELSALIGAFYHLKIDLGVHNDKKREKFYATKLREIVTLISLIPDFVTPQVKWDLTGTISESSGFALEKNQKNLWTMGDSGTGPFIAKLNLETGETQRVEVTNATNVDWEALVTGNENELFILDVGDNQKKRKNVSIYKIQTTNISDNKVNAEKMDFSYAEGPMDCESAVIFQNHLYLFEKIYFLAARVYSLDLTSKNLKPKLVGRLPAVPLLTDASLVDNRLFALTYTGIIEIENWTNLPSAKIRNVTHAQLGQTEALAALTPKKFLVSREDGKVFQINVK